MSGSQLAPGSLREYLREACDRSLAAMDANTTAARSIAAVQDRLAEDLLRVAVGGRLKAGKSTLVNALLGQSLAATDATECTKLVSWFLYGPVDLVRLRFADGAARELIAQPLSSAVASAGRPAWEISVVEVESSNDTLHHRYTIVDTPGLDALSGLDDMSLTALAQADVLVYLMPHPGENDARALEALSGTAATAGITAVNTIGVLSQIDLLGDGTGDPWPVARRQAARDAKRLGDLVSTVIPVHGLLASTALGAAFGEPDMVPLRALAAASRSDIEDACYSGESFLAAGHLPIDADARARILSLLGIYGIGVAVEAISGGVRGAPGLLEVLRERSGIDALLARLDRQFVALADPLRARIALQALDAASWIPVKAPAAARALVRLRADLDAIRSDRRLRQLSLARSLADLNAGQWSVPDEAAQSLTAFATGTTLAEQLGLKQAGDSPSPDKLSEAELRTTLIRQISAWRTIENTASRVTARHARVVREYLESLYGATE